MNKYLSYSEEETIALGKKFAEKLKKGSVIGLVGELGTGKTRFVKGIAEYFNVNDVVNSPTFLIVNQYIAKDNQSQENFYLYHFDLYRIYNTTELEELGFDEYINDNSIVVVEWPFLAEKYMNTQIDKIFFFHGNDINERIIKF